MEAGKHPTYMDKIWILVAMEGPELTVTAFADLDLIKASVAETFWGWNHSLEVIHEGPDDYEAEVTTADRTVYYSAERQTLNATKIVFDPPILTPDDTL